jgi:hypothetical protein
VSMQQNVEFGVGQTHPKLLFRWLSKPSFPKKCIIGEECDQPPK